MNRGFEKINNGPQGDLKLSSFGITSTHETCKKQVRLIKEHLEKEDIGVGSQVSLPDDQNTYVITQITKDPVPKAILTTKEGGAPKGLSGGVNPLMLTKVKE